MFKPTKPFNDRLTAYPKEPSLRIGRTVPEHAINLAYYFNPTATDVEKILTAEAPRNTIDHRIEEAYRYLFDQATDDDDLFPGYVSYEDEEGYQGKLGRMYVQWYPEAHIEIKNVQKTQQIVTTTKSGLPKMFEYSDEDGYSGNLYLDTETYTVTKERDITTTELRDREVFNHEVSFHEAFGRYIQPGQLDLWMVEPGLGGSQFPYQINISGNRANVIGSCNNTILNHIKTTPVDQYEYASGDLEFDHLEYQQVAGDRPAESGETSEIRDSSLLFFSQDYHYDGTLAPPTTTGPGTGGGSTDVTTPTEPTTPVTPPEPEQPKAQALSPMRTTAPSTNDKYWVHNSKGGVNECILISGKSCLPNCVGYAWGRFYEITGTRPNLSRGNAEMWYGNTSDKYQRSQEPKPGAVICWAKGKVGNNNDGAGHVAIVERVNPDGSILISESGYRKGETYNPNSTRHFWTETLTKESGYMPSWAGSSYRFQGFILPPTAPVEEVPYTGANGVGDGPTMISEAEVNNFVLQCESNARSKLKSRYESSYNISNDTYSYGEIQNFINTFKNSSSCSNPGHSMFTALQQAMSDNKDIVIVMDRMDMKVDDPTNLNTNFRFAAQYIAYISGRGREGTYEYNVIAVYKGTLKKQVTIIKKIAAEYLATANYVGIARKVWYDYDGMAYYRGAVTKGNGVGNVNPSDDNEILMFSDDQGYLRRPVWVTDENGVQELKNFYRVESDYVYLTDVFKNGVACFYMHPLKRPIYDYRGPDDRGFYEGDAVKLFTAGMKDVPEGYEHSLKLRPAEMETVDKVSNDFNLVSQEVPMRYWAELYTSFLSTSTDTFKVTYNAFDDNDKDNVALDNGVTEEIYGYPFMIQGTDFELEEVDAKARVNKIRLPEPARIEDTRHYISFEYTITAENKATGKSVTTSPRTASILNRDYVVPAEYSKFDGRAMIISPESDGILQSPIDMVLYDQAASKTETVITSKSTGFIFYATITKIDSSSRGGVNIRCNPDGSGYITAETTIETGFWDERIGSYTKKLCLDSPYFVEGGYIYPGFKVKCIDARHIKVLAPREDDLLESWYPRLQFGHYSQILDQYGTHTKVCYTMPEYDLQHFSTKYGKPYVNVEDEQVTVLNSHMIKTQCYPLRVESVSIFKKVDDELFPIKIKDISFSDGVVITKDSISENDTIVANYSYVEESYVYRGFWRNEQDFARIDLNPNIYHTYSDLTYTPSEDKPSKNLFNKVIYFFMRPRVIYEIKSEKNDSLIFDLEDDSQIGEILTENEDCLYHKIDDAQPDSDIDIYIGSVYIRQNTSLHSTILVDSRTRGGGVISSMKDSLRKELEPESDFYLDIGYYDGEPYQENGVIIIRLDNSLLKEFGGRFTQGDIEAKVKRWLGFGIYPIIEYVDAYSKREMPQYNLEVTDSYSNILPETPEIWVECIQET